MSKWWFDENDETLVHASAVRFDFLKWKGSYDIDYGVLDEGIKKTIQVLNEGGVHTFHSCEGHNQAPYVICDLAKHPIEIADILHKAGAFGFEIRDSWEFGCPDYCVRRIHIIWSHYKEGLCK